jgi:hypothetical protein
MEKGHELINSQYWQSSQTPEPDMMQLHLKVNKQWMVSPTTTKGCGIRKDKM